MFKELIRPYTLVNPWKKKEDPLDFKIHVSLCIFRTIQTAVLDSLFKLMFIKKPHITISHFVGDALIDRARSREASDFYLNTDADVFCQFDDDIQIDPLDIVRVCQKAYEMKSIVAGTCVVKREDQPWIAAKFLPGTEEVMLTPDSPLLEVEYAGSGFMVVHRNVFTDLIQEGKLPFCHPKDLKFWPFFLPMIHKNVDGEYEELSEDYAFCQRAREVGHKVWLDPSVRSIHFGTYGYSVDDICRKPREHYEKIKYVLPKGNFIPKDDGVKLEPISA